MEHNKRLIDKFLHDKGHITVDDCDKLLDAYGYKPHKSSGSHRTYHKKGTYSITIVNPKGRKYILTPYVTRLIRDLGIEE
jgi:predicted RNA binding protein YcfA (HicA-like mRNA interferase family)